MASREENFESGLIGRSSGRAFMIARTTLSLDFPEG